MNGPDDGKDDRATAKEINKVEDFVPKGVLGDSLFCLLEDDQRDVINHLH